MAFTNFDIITYAFSVLNKDKNANVLSDNQYEAGLNFHSIRLFDAALRSIKKRQKDNPNMIIPRDEQEMNAKHLLPFFVKKVLPVTSGIVDVSNEEIEYLLNVHKNPPVGRGFDIVTPAELSDRLSNAVTVPTESSPIIFEKSDTELEVYPKSITSIVLMYYKTPVKAIYKTKPNVTTGLAEYDTENSVELEWGDTVKQMIGLALIKGIGVAVENISAVQVADNIIKTGQ